MTLEPLWLG